METPSGENSLYQKTRCFLTESLLKSRCLFQLYNLYMFYTFYVFDTDEAAL